MFWNRQLELNQIKKNMAKGGFGYVTGRRRVGKTALLAHACRELGGFYHQAVEGTPAQQLAHLAQELAESLPIFKNVVPKTWAEFFSLLTREKLPPLVGFDEFPYWVEAFPSLPSFFQKWLDHDLPPHTLVLVSGSSQAMLYSQFLEKSAPLYGRASLHLHLAPMSYAWFCKALGYPRTDPDSFLRYSWIGGIPRYWKLLPKTDILSQVSELFFEQGALLAEEPIQILRDEGVTGGVSKAILDLVGRGVTKPSELASRIGTLQSNLSRPLALLLDLGLIQRELPFGESIRSSKKVAYRMEDQALSLYYGVYLPQRSLWSGLDKKSKQEIVHQHAAYHWEVFCRKSYPGSSRYWEPKMEIDMVAPIAGGNSHLVAECKWTKLSVQDENRILAELKQKFVGSALKNKFKKVEFRVFSQKNLGELTALQME